jgi:hypothetical protein
LRAFDILPKSQRQPPKATLNEGQIELYKYLQFTKSSGGQVCSGKLKDLYVKYVLSRNKRVTDVKEIHEDIFNMNMNRWVDSALAAFVRRGYVSLHFNVKADKVDKYKGNLMRAERVIVDPE